MVKIREFSLSIKIYLGLVLLLAISGALNVYLPQGDFLGATANQQLPASKPVIAVVSALTMLLLYGGLGYLGLRLGQKLHFPNLWDEDSSWNERLFRPGIVGVLVGLFFIIVDTVFSHFQPLGPLQHPPFPTSLIASLSAGIGEEIIFRLFFISFWVWLISSVIMKGGAQNVIFWIVAIFSAIIFALGHLPSVVMMYHLQSMSSIPIMLLFEIFLLNGVVSIAAAHYFQQVGFLGAVSVHFWCDIVWHVIWGVIV